MIHNYQHSGSLLLKFLEEGSLLVNVGVYDAASALIASQFPETKGLFVSGLGYTYSQFAWPDVGLINSNEIINAAKIIRSNNPDIFLTCDIDSGLGGKEQLRRTCTELKNLGVSAVQLEDQTLDDKVCGHITTKVVRPLQESVDRLSIALETSYPMQVIARTDSSFKNEEAFNRLDAFMKAGAQIVIVDGINELELNEVIQFVNKRAFIMANVVDGGKLKQHYATYFQKLGISIMNLSSTLLFSSIFAMKQRMESMIKNNWENISNENITPLSEVNKLMTENYNFFISNNRKSKFV